MSDNQNAEQEVRFALVLYGGVSLAIYINGVVQEIRNLVRATSGIPLSSGEKKGSIPVYQRLASILERGKIPSGQLVPTDQKEPLIRTQFKVDIISGTSAGGINGIFLAKSLANNVAMTSLQDLWFDEGAIETLLNDKQSYAGTSLDQPYEVESLLNSRRMYLKLLAALDGMDASDRPPQSRDDGISKLADEIDLFATTTDIEGIPVPIQLFDNVVYERRYRNDYHFRFMGGERNDFQPDNNPFLAFAARCTSSFPFAFEPMQLCDIDDVLKKSFIYAKKQYCLSDSTRWQKYYTNYLEGVLPGSKPFQKRPFGDGAYLNNAPFSYAVDALVRRQSDIPMDRKLIYVEPSPQHPEEAPIPPDPPNAIQNSLDALVVIPGYQTIRNDLDQVLARNRAATKINKTLAEVDREIYNRARLMPNVEENPQEIWFSDEASSRAYYRMRSSEITDLIAQMVARCRSIDENSAYFVALRSLIRAWREKVFAVDASTSALAGGFGESEAGPGLTNFLADFDLPYRLRRLRFIATKLDGLYGLKLDPSNSAYSDAVTTMRFGLSEQNPSGGMPGGLTTVRARIGQQSRTLKKLLDDLLKMPHPEDKDTPPYGARTAATYSVGDLLPQRSEIVALLETTLQIDAAKGAINSNQRPIYATRETVRKSNEPADLEALCDLRARELVTNDEKLLETLTTLGNDLAGLLRNKLGDVHTKVTECFHQGAAGRIARRMYVYFDLFDVVQFPMMFGTDVVASDPVEIIRIAPEDTSRLIPDLEQRRTKLKGLLVAHFGAFLDRDWRVSDLLWGRLDAAERLITALLPWEESAAIRNQLIDEAHRGIFAAFDIETKLKDMATRQVVAQGPENKLCDASVRNLIDVVTPAAAPATLEQHQKLMQVWQDVVPVAMNRQREVETLARFTTIMGKILETISAKQNLPLNSKWLVNAGRAFWGVVEISVPRSALRHLGTYWQSLLFLIAVILIAAGVFSSQPGIAGVGWSLFAVACLLFTLRTILGSYMRGGRALSALVAITVTTLILMVGIGVWQTHRWIIALTSQFHR